MGERARNATGQRCAIVWVHKNKPSVEPLLRVLAEDVKFQFLYDSTSCIESNETMYTSVEYFRKIPFHYRPETLKDRKHINAWVPFDLPRNLELLHGDVHKIS